MSDTSPPNPDTPAAKDPPEKLAPEKPIKIEAKDNFKIEKNEIKEHKDAKHEKLEKNETKEHKDAKHEKLEKNEFKEHKDAKHEKIEKNEIKEHKDAKHEKIEHKEKIEKIERKEIAKLEHPEKVIFEGPIRENGNPVEARLAALEQKLQHFIDTAQRPDLSRGALSGEQTKPKG